MDYFNFLLVILSRYNFSVKEKGVAELTASRVGYYYCLDSVMLQSLRSVNTELYKNQYFLQSFQHYLAELGAMHLWVTPFLLRSFAFPVRYPFG